MNKKLFLLLLSPFCILCTHADARDNLIRELDAKLENRRYYMQIKERRIDSLRALLAPGTPLREQYRINDLIYGEYSTYRYDSAMYYVSKNRLIARKLHLRPMEDAVKLHTATLLATTGLFKESLDTLEHIDRATLDSSLLLDWYETNEWAYLRIKSYADDDFYSPVYGRQEALYIDSVFRHLPVGSLDYRYYRGYTLLRAGRTAEAETALLGLFADLPVDTRMYAIVTSNLATIYKARGDMRHYEDFLIKSAISDQECALKENRAIQELAIWLFTEHPEELERANRYIQYAMEDAQFFNNRVRTVQIARTLPVIVSAYQEKSRVENLHLKITVGIISLLAIGLIGAFIYIYKQMKLLEKSRLQLARLNNRLNWLNRELLRSNSQLTEANKTREEYVGLFIDLCSSYIDKIARYRNTVKRKIMARQIDDLYKMSNSPESQEAELASFFDNFDTAFLNLYPSFIEDFNELLTDEGKIRLKKGEKLNPELRVFALIRLGITDSSKIAAFLRFSPQTVYNYRAKVKKHARTERSEFEKHVIRIGAMV